MEDISWIPVALNASLSVSLGPLELSLSIPNEYSKKSKVDIDKTYTGYENGVNGNYTRSIRTILDKDYALTQIGQYFEARSALRDYGNISRSPQPLKATWYIKIRNAVTKDVYSYTCQHDVQVSIV